MDNLICGVHAVYETLRSRRHPIERIYLARAAHSGRLRQIIQLARERGIPVRKGPRAVLDHLAHGQAHQGIVAVGGTLDYAPFEALLKPETPLVVVLDGVEDPQNLGAILRSSEASGASGVVVPERHSAPLSGAVMKASAGAALHVAVVRVSNLVNAMLELKERGLWIVGLDPAGKRMWTDFDYTEPTALVLGGEHRGLRRLVRQHCDVLVRIPMQGRVEALNVSAAAAVMLYEVVRQRSRRE